MRLVLPAWLVAIGLIPGAAQAAPAPVTGRWLTEDAEAIVEIAPCGPVICGRIAKVLKTPASGMARDTKNPDPALRGRPIEGIILLSNFTPDTDRWRGRIYNPESGRTYRSEMIPNGNSLRVKGCWGIFCRGQTWTRVR